MSDADILIDLLENNKELATFLQPGDVAMLDQGLRNAIIQYSERFYGVTVADFVDLISAEFFDRFFRSKNTF